MATIKLQPSGKVLIKDGKVSCGCCEQPVCCMYPWPDPFNTTGHGPFYPNADLPTVIYRGISMTPSGYNHFYSGTGFPPSIDPNNPLYVGGTTRNLNSFFGRWLVVDGLGLLQDDIGKCLIGGNNIIEDEFADTYTVTGLPGPQQSVQIVRQSLCRWRGAAGGQKVLLRYWDGFESSAPSGADQIGWWLTVGEQGSNAIRKTGYQSSPDGSYGGFTVS